MPDRRCGECGGVLTNHRCTDCGTIHNGADTEGRDAREVIAQWWEGPGDQQMAWTLDGRSLLAALYAAVGVEGDGVLCLVREGDAVRVARAEYVGTPNQGGLPAHLRREPNAVPLYRLVEPQP